MTSLIEVVNSLFGTSSGPRHARSVEVIGDGIVHVEYPEDDHVYLVTVRQIPRIELPLQRPLTVCAPAGVPVQLVRIAVANHVEVTLDAAAGPARDAALADFEQRYRQWERDSNRIQQPPAWPAEQFSAIPIAVSDDLGTAYGSHSGEAGGHGTEFRTRWNFLPAAPDQATRLTVRLTPSEGTPGRARTPASSRFCLRLDSAATTSGPGRCGDSAGDDAEGAKPRHPSEPEHAFLAYQCTQRHRRRPPASRLSGMPWRATRLRRRAVLASDPDVVAAVLVS